MRFARRPPAVVVWEMDDRSSAGPEGDASEHGGDAPELDLVLYPHRSLSPTGFWLLMTLVAGVSFAAGLAFFLAGAWLVMGFLGLDVVLFYLAFQLNYRSGRVVETIRMRASDLVVRRTSPRGTVRTWSFQPYWLRVDLEGGAEGGGQLALCSHGQRLVIGAFLAPDERSEVACALRAALARVGAVHYRG